MLFTNCLAITLLAGKSKACDGDKLIDRLVLEEGEVELDGLTLREMLEEGLSDALGEELLLGEKLCEAEGDREAEGERDKLALADGLTLLEGLTDALIDALGL